MRAVETEPRSLVVTLTTVRSVAVMVTVGPHPSTMIPEWRVLVNEQ